MTSGNDTLCARDPVSRAASSAANRKCWRGLSGGGVAFEFRFKADEAHRPFWDKAFAWGSYIATFFRGRGARGSFVDGFQVSGGVFVGGALIGSVLSACSPALVFSSPGALLGCTWLIMKTEGELQRRMTALAKPVALVLVATIAIVSIWTPLAHPEAAQRWFSLPNLSFLCTRSLARIAGDDLAHSLSCQRTSRSTIHLGVVPAVSVYSGLAIGLWPNIIPLPFRSGRQRVRLNRWASRLSARVSFSPSS